MCFSNRQLELARLLDMASRYLSVPLVAYGPEGCGKTALLRGEGTRLATPTPQSCGDGAQAAEITASRAG
ncbi:MAG: ATP-binding protein [Pyrobaculum arsenaticum]|uniref:ATPase domain-containing protein n=1 Tax=Pyrobaculum arsenaticum (strain DSM 13514 / JCM 11321 / PZ6) TaxID=340102 RepID=A4WJF8_PYRAR|nr:ATP-binding protein [Pyrobaculum arsenaticum]ABP50525.1 hypothetical protein Pars_0945 [Pyrobaculum arsenaticum DSM 13514]MCY0890511.1 ATP-binding protein [Pyrobaculum arsenaticum]